MTEFLGLLLHVLVSPLKTRARLEAEIVMLRHQLNVLRRRAPLKPKLARADRLLFAWLYRLFPSVLSAVAIVQPETMVRWHRAGFRLSWRWQSRSHGGRPKTPVAIRRLISCMIGTQNSPGRSAPSLCQVGLKCSRCLRAART